VHRDPSQQSLNTLPSAAGFTGEERTQAGKKGNGGWNAGWCSERAEKKGGEGRAPRRTGFFRWCPFSVRAFPSVLTPPPGPDE